MYFALALLIADFDLVPEDVVGERDIDFVGDFFVGGVRNDSPGVRVKVRKVTLRCCGSADVFSSWLSFGPHIAFVVV